MNNSIKFEKSSISPSECVSDAWNLASLHYGLLFAVSLTTLVFLFLSGVLPYINFIVQAILTGPIMVGLYYVFLKKIDDEETEYLKIFQGFNKFVPAMIISLIIAAPGIIFQLIVFAVYYANLSLGGIESLEILQSNNINLSSLSLTSPIVVTYIIFYFLAALAFRITFYFPLMLLAEHDISPIKAIKLGANAGWANLGGILVLMIFQVLLGLLGSLACGIGVLFIMPVIFGSDLYAYRRVFPKQDSLQNNIFPPSPTNYVGLVEQPDSK